MPLPQDLDRPTNSADAIAGPIQRVSELARIPSDVARIFLEQRDLGNDIRRLVQWLDESRGGPAAECVPPVDVFETPETVEVVVDLPGVPLESISVTWSLGMLVIAGRKSPGGCNPERPAAFHLAERGFGRFARAIRLAGAFDASRATATLTTGELHVVVPRIDDRRGREITVAVRTA
jgi:HSP20 family protein